MTEASALASYERKKAELARSFPVGGSGELRLAKSTISNLFRYQPRQAGGRRVSLAGFNGVLAIDTAARTADVEGLATYSTVVTACLEKGLLPLVAPELKHITVGGATVGIGIESTCFRHGFVHDGLIEADVLLPGGDVVTCRADNQHADLFRALPNSYGTLGYILRARIALQPALPFVRLRIERFGAIRPYLDAMRAATESGEADFVEGLFFEDRRFYLMTGRFESSAVAPADILREHVFYKLVQERNDIPLRTADYIFRYDPEWFWNIPESLPYRLFRRYAPASMRNSGFYTKYAATKNRLAAKVGLRDDGLEPLIQDWEVPWPAAEELMQFCLDKVRLDGRPWAAVPIVTPRQPTLYPIRPNELYFNLGCYCQVRKPEGKEPYHYTKIMDRKCFDLGGIKMLYSSTFLSEQEFDARYNGTAYRELKQKYDPSGNAPTLYRKVAQTP